LPFHYECSTLMLHMGVFMTKRAFGELESQILYIMKSGDRRTVKEVHQALGGKDNYNTVMTVMSRLAEKKQLGREKMGLHYEYWVIKIQDFSFLKTLKQKFFGVKTSLVINHLLESADDLSDEDLAEMEKLIEKAKQKK
jgi:predicted transcriptional regulator